MIERMYTDATLVDFYDSLCSGRSDFAFYLPMVMSVKSVLDVGCGTGRLLHLARDSGHTGRLCGLDPSPAMVVRARERADVEWVVGDPATLPWQAEFDLIVMTGHAFQVLVDDDDIRCALAGIRRALTGDGRFAFDIRNPRVREWENWTERNATQVMGESGEMASFWREYHAPVVEDVVSYSSVFSRPDWHRPRVSPGRLRYLTPERLAEFLTGAGLTVREQYGDWGRQPLTETSSELITIAGPR